MFLEKKDCFEFLNIDVTLPLYFLQNSVDPADDFALRNKVFPLLHCTFNFFHLIANYGRFMRLGRTPFGIQVSMVVLKTFLQFCS